jgi:4-hydroxybenzoate polyprenyltransferase
VFGLLTRTLVISRPVFWASALSLYWLGVLIADQAKESPTWLGLFFFSFPMGVIIYGLNDIADKDADLKNPRKGGVDGALIKNDEIRTVKLLSACLVTIFFLNFLLTGHYIASLLVILITVFSIAYSFKPIRLKNRPIIDSLSNGLWTTMILVTGLVIAGNKYPAAPTGKFLIIAFLSGFAFHALGTILDYDADRAVGEQTISQYLGKRPVALLTTAALVGIFILMDSAYVPLKIFFGACSLLSLFIFLRPDFEVVARLKDIFFALLVVPLPLLFILMNLQ